MITHTMYVISRHSDLHTLLTRARYKTALKSGGLDEALIAELPEALLERVNVHRVGKCLTPLVRKAASQQGDVNLLSWINSACPKVRFELFALRPDAKIITELSSVLCRLHTTARHGLAASCRRSC